MRLLELRQGKNLSQREIAEILAILPQQYYRYETEQRELPIKHAIKLADYYEVTLDYLVGRK